MEGMIDYFKGYNGQIALYENRVVITRKGTFAKFYHGFFKGEVTLYFSQISGVQFKKGGLMQEFIQFVIPGEIKNKRGLINSYHDENSVMFTYHGNKAALEFKRKIDNFIRTHKSEPVVKDFEPADEIKKYKDLLDAGAITQDEYNAKKKQLLNI